MTVPSSVLLQFCAPSGTSTSRANGETTTSVSGAAGSVLRERQYTAEAIPWAVRWYLMFSISYRDRELMLVEQDHRNVKRLTCPGLGFGSFWTARRTLAGYEAMAMIRKGQVRNIGGDDIKAQAKFVASLFEVAA